jgi:hypothetical protein
MPHPPILIYRPGAKPLHSRNLRGILSYHRRGHCAVRIETQPSVEPGRYWLVIEWSDGARANAQFADSSILRDFVAARVKRGGIWHGADWTDTLPKART